MRSRYRVHEPDRAHFVTSTITGWLPVFTSPACCEILTASFAYCREHKGLRLHGWVIMENHFHAIVRAPGLSAVLADLKKFTARRLLAQLAGERRDWLLRLLDEGKAAHKTRSLHQIWQEGFHPQAILEDAMMIQSRAERDRLRVEPQPAGCRRRAASTWNTFITTPCGAGGCPSRLNSAVTRRYP
jgi:REP element-mobilizing transposase RayT